MARHQDKAVRIAAISAVLLGTVAGQVPGCPEEPSPPVVLAPPVSPEEERAFYALGVMLARNVNVYGLSEVELGLVQRGMGDALAQRKLLADPDELGPRLVELAQARQQARMEQEKSRSKAYLDKAAAMPGAEKLPSGVIILEHERGKGDIPQSTDLVKVRFRGTLTDGTEFENTEARGQPAVLALNNVIRCWLDVLGRMRAGARARVVCPAETAYGERGHPPRIPGGAALILEVTLLDVVRR